MSIPNVARQYPLSVWINLQFGDVPLHATAYTICEIPQGSVITRFAAYMIVAFAGTGTYDADFGDVTDPNRYTATATEIDDAADTIPTNAPAVTGYKTTASEPNFTTPVTQGSTGNPPTAGDLQLTLDYITSGRNNENLG